VIKVYKKKTLLKKLSKKGVSPLIATVLLIAFAVALGAVVMNWGKTYVEDQADKVGTKGDKDLACTSDVDLAWFQRNNVDQVCYGANYVLFTLENTGDKAISGMKLVIDGNTDIFTNSSFYNESFAVGSIKKFNRTYDNATYGIPQEIRIIPNVEVNQEDTVCIEAALKKSDPTVCS